ncbi:MAG: hypothetical protein L0L17_09325, partial [Yaniella sp.]|nr:hypothetical protein [Yaniella sp.]
MNQQYFPDEPPRRNVHDAQPPGEHHADAPPPPPPGPPPGGPGGDPRNDPRWVYSPHASRDESREIPYFSRGYQPVETANRPPPRRRHGPLSALSTGAGILGFAFLLIGLLSQVFDWDTQSNPLQEFFDPQPQAPQVVPDGEGSVDSLIAGLDHVHEGIAVDWEAGGQHTGEGLDPGQEVGSAPGVFMVDTQVYQYMGFGTGVVVSSSGLAITN